jgi:diacylglycerol kinase (ATP)
MPKRMLIMNARAGAFRTRPSLRHALEARASSAWEVEQPLDVATLWACVDRSVEQGVAHLAIAGGDGTLHQVVTRLLSMGLPTSQLPLIWVIPCGTMNILARCLGLARHPLACWDTMDAALEADGIWTRTEQRTLSIEGRHGFLFGNGVVASFLDEYNRLMSGSSHPSVPRLLVKRVGSALVGGVSTKALNQPYCGEVRCDGQLWEGERWTAVAAGTVVQIGMGFRPFPEVLTSSDAMQVVGIGTGLRGLVWELPRIRMGWALSNPSNRTTLCRHLELRGPSQRYMVDGELYDAPESGVLTVRVGERVGFGVPR